MLVKTGAGVNGTNALGETALFPASRAGNASTVQLLVKFGANPNVVSRSAVYAPDGSCRHRAFGDRAGPAEARG